MNQAETTDRSCVVVNDLPMRPDGAVLRQGDDPKLYRSIMGALMRLSRVTSMD